ncbi:MAG: hypothetical protein A2Y17_05815 [Clostridiales bacterium GWF2_38_85]|nr:MAG: hypothetical protein A2Y17_05815 [Clostridiales bacterium GWF2_38_85]
MEEKRIIGIANQILKETNLYSIPIEVVAIANYYGFKVYEISMDDKESGLLVVDKKTIPGFRSNRIIIVNSNHSAERKRFTIAHELGHYFLSENKEVCIAHKDSGDYSPEERDANYFASVLLMPVEMIEGDIKKIHKVFGKMDDTIIVYKIARNFYVSRSAVQVRLKKIGVV